MSISQSTYLKIVAEIDKFICIKDKILNLLSHEIYVEASEEKSKYINNPYSGLADNSFIAAEKYLKKDSVNQDVKQNILDNAKEIIYGDREQLYGDPGKNIRLITDSWSNYLQTRYGITFYVDEKAVCDMMILLKLARLTNNPNHYDSVLDIVGYAALRERISPSNG